MLKGSSHKAGSLKSKKRKRAKWPYLQALDLIDSSVYKMVCVGWAAAEVDAYIPLQGVSGPRGLHSKEGAHRHTVHLQVWVAFSVVDVP